MPDAETGLFNFSDFNNLAVLQYEGAECDEPYQDPTVDVPTSKLPLVETNLHVSFAFLSDLFSNSVNISYYPAPCHDACGTFFSHDPLYVDF